MKEPWGKVQHVSWLDCGDTETYHLPCSLSQMHCQCTCLLNCYFLVLLGWFWLVLFLFLISYLSWVDFLEPVVSAKDLFFKCCGLCYVQSRNS